MSTTIRLFSFAGPGHCARHMPPQLLPPFQQLAFTQLVAFAVVQLMAAGTFDPARRACCQLGDAKMDEIARQVPGVWALRN